MNSKGFTLIELLVVVAIIGILAAVGVVAYNGYTNSAKTAVVKANEKTIIKFIKLTFQRCDIEGPLVQVEGVTTPNGGKIECLMNSGTSDIYQANQIFSNYFTSKFGQNPFDNSKPLVIHSGKEQPEGTISLDTGLGNSGQCNSNVKIKTVSTNNCFKIVTWLSAYPNGRNDVDIFMSHW